MTDAPAQLTILGATGSIGGSTLDVVRRHRDRIALHALTAHANDKALVELCLEHQPRYAVLVDEAAAERAQQALKHTDVAVLQGSDALCQVAGDECVDMVMAAIVGAAGLPPTLQAARCGKRVLLANKEALVMAGALFMAEVEGSGAQVLPIDSEHNALFQCMPAGYRCGTPPAGVESIMLTASGGPFRDWPAEDLNLVTPEQACAHPNWDMGRKISVDSATLMNKGLEVIEAHWLFALPRKQIQVVVHPQSIVHSLVAYRDGSVLAQMGEPDMRTPIAFGLCWPERIAAGVKPLDLLTAGRLDFEAPDQQRFPCLRLAFEALEQEGIAPTVLNAANEVAVAAFLDGSLPFARIPAVIESTLTHMNLTHADTIQGIIEADQQARAIAGQRVAASS